MNLLIQNFPDEVRWQLRERAFREGVTLRELVIRGLSELAAANGNGVGKVREVGMRIKGQMERLGKSAEPEDELKF